MINKLACTAAVLAALPLTDATAALDYFLKIDGAPGESQDSKHKNEIDVLTWSWGASVTGSRTEFEPFSWEQGLDSSFVPLFLGLAGGEQFHSALLTVRRAGKEQQEFFKMTLSEPLVVSLSSKGSGDSVLVDAAMSYSAITMRYAPTKPDGTLGSFVQGSWDLREGKVAFSGDPTVLLGLAEAGGTLNFVNQVPEPATWATLLAGLGAVATLVRRRRAPSTEPAGETG